MKLIPILAAVSLAATAPSVRSQTTVFSDNFSSSTLNPTATAPGVLNASTTAYEIASSKNATATVISGGALTLGPVSTTSGYAEAQALFTTSPVTLSAPGQYIQVYYTFTDTASTFNGNANDNAQINIGLYNSGGSAPTNGTLLWNGGLSSSQTTAVNGGTKGWVGYSAMMAYTKASPQPSAIYTRPAQTGANNLNQGLGPVSGNSGGVNMKQISGVVGQPLLTTGNKYTLSLKLTYVSATSIEVTETLYNGTGINGTVFSSGGFTANIDGTGTPSTFTFDALEVGFRPTSSPSTAESLQVNNITVLAFIPTAPTIAGLTNQTVVAGTNPTIAPAVGGTPAPACQWYVSTDGGATSNAIPAGTNSSLTLNNVQYLQNNNIYSLVASNSMGTAVGNMTLTVIVPPSITGLFDQAVLTNSDVLISPTVSGVPTPALQWQFNGVNLSDGLDANGSTIAGSTSSSLTILGATLADSGTYSLIASNSAGMMTNSMKLTVASSDLPPTLTGPSDVSVIQGSNATFSASASGLPLPSLQWLDQTGAPIPGATANTLTLYNVQYSQNGYIYSVVASNSVGSVTNGATLLVLVPPAITAQPTNLVVLNGQPASFSVAATGAPAPKYQWYRNGLPVSSALTSTATNATLTLASVSPSDMANYYVVVTNSAGSVTSATVSLTVNSAIAVASLSPSNNASGLCYDTALTIAFNSTPVLGAAGSIKIFNVTNSAAPVDTINVALGAVQQRTFPGDGQSFSYKTIVINGNSVTIYPHSSIMTSNQTYYVTIDNGAFVDSTGAYFAGITDSNVWQFTTKPGGPVDPNNPVVDADGSADFLTVQGAVNSLPAGTSPTQRVISIRDGLYTEIVDIAGKHNVTFRGQSRAGTLVGYPNNASFQVANNGTVHARMAFKVNANDIVLENLTITNMTPQGGSQAEALMIESNAKRCIVNNADINSRQDTILGNVNSSQAYFYRSTVRGNFDYIWGGGNLYFDKCTVQTIAGTGSGQLTAARTDTSASTSANFPWQNPFGTYTANGVSFVNCSFTSDPGLGNITLAGSNGTSNNLVSWAGCQFATNYVTPSSTLFNGNYLFWQYQNTDLSGSPVSFSSLTAIGATNNDPRLMAATNVATWFYGWTPALAPNIVSQPVSQAASSGQPVNFTVVATGIPDPSYQWYRNGSLIPDATNATCAIPGATRADAGNYCVAVSNASGTVTSSIATLTYNNTAPVAQNLTIALPGPGSTNLLIIGGHYAPFDADSDALTITSVSAPAYGTTSTDGTNITYTLTNNVNGVDSFTYTVNDGFGGTATGTVAALVGSNGANFNHVAAPQSLGGNDYRLPFVGVPGSNYALDWTTNLSAPVVWLPQGTNTAAGDGTLMFTNNQAGAAGFWRMRLVP